MAYDFVSCPACGTSVKVYRNPLPTVDIIVETGPGIILIERKNEPYGWAIPGGFVDYGESVEEAAAREAREETSVGIDDLRLLGCYSNPRRDPRHHTISIVFVATGHGTPQAADDAASLRVFPLDDLPRNLCFDHRQILDDYISRKRSGGV